VATYLVTPSPLGPLLLAASGRGLCWCAFCDTGPETALAEVRRRWPEERFAAEAAGPLGAVAEQLAAYFGGRLRTFRVACDLQGTPWQRAVWQALARIPFGEVRTYAQVARELGRPGAARAVGAACAANPVSLIVPCHRVVAADGGLGGYTGGPARKRWLLAHERAACQRASVGAG
jgi:methylated-DNA-[protein]-cysteine S-methyltransferase